MNSALPNNPKLRAWKMVVWISGMFSLSMALLMLFGYLSRIEDDPLNSPNLKLEKQKLRESPADDSIKQRIRQLDLQLRQSFFQQLNQRASGTYLLLGGVALFLVATNQVRRELKQPPFPLPKTPDPELDHKRARLARWAVVGSGVVIAALLLVLSFGSVTPLPRQPKDVEKLLGAGSDDSVPNDGPTAEEMLRNWPEFRGVNGSGFASCANAPAVWDTNTGAGLLWKVKSPSPGFNSPIVWGDRVFFSGGDAVKREVFCLGLKGGDLLWRAALENVPGSPAQPPEIPESTGYAAPTMASDGRRVYAIFANGDLGAFSLDGKLVWSKGFGALKNPYGHATSLCTWRDRVIVQLDQGEAEDGKSKLYALDGRAGKVIWQRPRKAGGSWASPIAIEAAGKSQVITLAVPNVVSYSATDGAELWRADCLNGEITPSPAFAGGLVFIVSPSEKLIAIRPDGQGDVTKTHLVWTAEDNVPDVTSPASNGEFVFTVTTGGFLTCWDAKDGKKQWEHDFEMECHASPVISSNRVYLISQNGAAVIVEAGRQFKQLFRTEMGDGFHASPAFAQDKIVLRGVNHVWCLGGGK
jgi:outer membrane protein assembly factor BamB